MFDTETTTDDAQRLLFGFYRSCSVNRDGTITVDEEGIVFPDELPSWRPDEYEVLQAYANDHSGEDRMAGALRMHPLSTFIEDVLFPAFRDAGAWIVGFNLPFDLSRLACDWGPAKSSFYGGFWFEFTTDKREPRVRIKTLNSKAALIDVYADGDYAKRQKKRKGGVNPAEMIDVQWDLLAKQRAARNLPRYAQFLDLKTLAWALTGRSHSLASACKAFHVAGAKSDAGGYGTITTMFVEYARNDVRITTQLYEYMMREYRRHPIPIPATKAFSTASIGKGYLRAMGITPIMERENDVPDWVLGMASIAYYGGRTEMRIRDLITPVVYTDATAMYSTVNALVGTWRYVIAEKIEWYDATSEVQTLLDAITAEDCFNQQRWPEFVGLAFIKPDGDMLPVRANYSAMWDGQVNDVAIGTSQISISAFTADHPYPYALPDLIASKIATGRAPKVVRAVRFRAVGKLKGLRAIKLRGEVKANPRQDLFKQSIELRQATRQRADLDETEQERTVAFLKVFANATGYGIYAEITRRELPKDSPVKVIVSDGQQEFVTITTSPETLGPFAFMPLAACITAGARLMLALMIHETTSRGGSYAFTDTDSLAIVATETGASHCNALPESNHDDCRKGVGCPEGVPTLSWARVREIVDRFELLNPYDPSIVPGSILKIEDENYPPDKKGKRSPKNGPQCQLFCYGISSKRYVLLELINGTPDIVDSQHVNKLRFEISKYSEHGLGYLSNPTGVPGKGWIKAVWESILHEKLQRPHEPPDWLDLQATGQETITSPALLKPFDGANKRRKRYHQIRPFNFFATAYVHQPLGVPYGADRDRFFLIHPYETDKRKLARASWINRHDGRRYKIAAIQPNYDVVMPEYALVKSYRDVVEAYRKHGESKFSSPNGEHPARATGMLEPRNITALVRPNLIGKEANKIEERVTGIVQREDVTSVYRREYSAVPDRESVAARRVNDPVWLEVILPVLRHIGAVQLSKEIGRISLRGIEYLLTGEVVPQSEHRRALQERALDFASSENMRLDLTDTRDPLAISRLLLDYYALHPKRCTNLGCENRLTGRREKHCSNRCRMEDRKRTHYSTASRVMG